MRSDSPGPEWYEPIDLADDDDAGDPHANHQEILTVAGGIVHWTAAPDDDD